MKLKEVPGLITKKIYDYYSFARNGITNSINYLKNISYKNLAWNSLSFLYTSAKFAFKFIISSALFVVAALFFIQATGGLGIIFPPVFAAAAASLGVVTSNLAFQTIFAAAAALLALRLSGPPYTAVKYALYAITAPFIYVAKKVSLFIVDYFLHEFGVVSAVENRPVRKFFQLSSSYHSHDIDDESVNDFNDYNPSIDATISADLFSVYLGPFKFTPGALFRYVLDPFNLKNHVKKVANFAFYQSGLEDRARYLLSQTPVVLEKKRLEQAASANAKQELLEIAREHARNLDLKMPANFKAALRLIATNKHIAQIKLDNNQNWFHIINKTIIDKTEYNSYVAVANHLLSLSISPYDRDNNGNTAFKNSPNLEINESVRRVIHGGVPANAIGLHSQMETLKDFFINSQNTEEVTAETPANNMLILEGPPGTGKTEAVKITVKDTNFQLIQFQIGAVNDRYVGQLEGRIKRTFAEAKQSGLPTCIFIDEIDALMHNREASANQAGNEGKVITTFQQEIDNLKGTKVVVVGATNYPERVKPAILSRAGVPIKFTFPDFESRKEILEDKLRECSFVDAKVIIERMAIMYESQEPRALGQLVIKVRNMAKRRCKMGDIEFKGELLLEDFEAAHSDFSKSKSSNFELIYPKIKISQNKFHEKEVSHIEPAILQELELVDKFFGAKFTSAFNGTAVKFKATLLTDFSAAYFRKSMANHNTKCATVYIDAANLTGKFEEELTNTLNPLLKVMVIIDNIDKVDAKKSSKLQKLLSEMSGSGRSIYVLGATQKTSKTNEIWPDFFRGNIVKSEPINDREQIFKILENVFDTARNRGIKVNRFIMNAIRKDNQTVDLLVGNTITQIVAKVDALIMRTEAHATQQNEILLFSNMLPHIQTMREPVASSRVESAPANRASQPKGSHRPRGHT